MQSNVPDFLQPQSDSERINVHRNPQTLILCQSQTRCVLDGKAQPGQFVFPDPVTPLPDECVHVAGFARYWVLYDSEDAGAKMVWVKPDTADTRSLPECQWHGDTRPDATQVIRLVLWSPSLGLFKLNCQRSAVRVAEGVLGRIAAIGCVPWGVTWKLTSELQKKRGTYYTPSFTQVGYCDSETAEEFRRLEADIAHACQLPRAEM